jgi:hypothetical protein
VQLIELLLVQAVLAQCYLVQETMVVIVFLLVTHFFAQKVVQHLLAQAPLLVALVAAS